jgi:uncharacterized protein (TIGR02996 family)
MASVLALISKAVFEKLGKLALGDRPRMDRYVSSATSLTPLEDGGSLFLVTVRPGERLWLCAILRDPKFEKSEWRASPSDVPITDVTDVLPRIRFASGAGIHAPEGRLGTSLHTPRQLADDDVSLLRRAVALARAQRKPPVEKPVQHFAANPTEPVRAVPPVTAWGPDVDTLFAAVVATPDDEAARRVLADGLMEAGDPQGEFIQLACDAAALGRSDPKRAELEARAADLRRRHSLAFSRRLRQVPFFNRSSDGAWSTPFTFDRGLPDHVRGPSRGLVPALADAAKVSPVRGVHLLEARAEDVRALARMPELANVRALGVTGHEALSGALPELFASPHLARLERLELQCPIEPKDLAALGACAALDGLRSLSLMPTLNSTAPVDALLRSERCARLRSLKLSTLPATAESIVGLSALEDLELLAIRFGAAGATLLATKLPRTLRKLGLTNCELGAKGMRALVYSSELASLETLELHGMVTGRELEPFLDAFALPAITRLALSGSPLRAEGAPAFVAAAKKFGRLRALDLQGAHIKDNGARPREALALDPREPRPRRERHRAGGHGGVGIWAAAQERARLVDPQQQMRERGRHRAGKDEGARPAPQALAFLQLDGGQGRARAAHGSPEPRGAARRGEQLRLGALPFHRGLERDAQAARADVARTRGRPARDERRRAAAGGDRCASLLGRRGRGERARGAPEPRSFAPDAREV